MIRQERDIVSWGPQVVGSIKLATLSRTLWIASVAVSGILTAFHPVGAFSLYT